MRYAIISDIHANIAALRTVLADMQDLKVEKLICLGDVLGYGPDPVPTLEAVYSRVHVCLAGNHDDAVCGRCSTEDFNDFAAAAVSRQRRALTPEAIAWLKNLPYECSMDGFACAHGDFSAPENFNYVQDPEDARPSWEARSEPLLFVGHTHEPGVYMLGKDGVPHRFDPVDFAVEDGVRYLVNVGSVGYPRSGICRSSYCIYDGDTKNVFFRSLPFDLEGYREKMGGKGLDEAPWMAARAAARATPLVRERANFGKPGASPPRAKVIKVEHSAPQTVVATPPARHSVWPWVLVAAFALVLAGALAFYLVKGREMVARPPAAEAPSRTSEMPPATMAAAKAPPAAARPVAKISTIVEKRELRLTAGDGKIYFAVKLSPKSHPAKVRLSFMDAKGNAMAEGEQVFQPVAASITRATARNAVEVPPGAAGVVLEVHRLERLGLTEVAGMELDVKELKRGRKK